MSEIVLGVGASHSTLMNTHWDEVDHLPEAHRFRDGLAAAQRALAEAEPDAVVVIGSNHFRGLFLDLMPSITLALSFGGLPAAADQMVGSAFMQKMATKPDTVAGVKYTTIVTKYDEVVTPYQSQFLTGTNVDNILLQDRCDKDYADHIAVAFDHIALQYVLNALDPANARTPTCSTVLPAVGG